MNNDCIKQKMSGRALNIWKIKTSTKIWHTVWELINGIKVF